MNTQKAQRQLIDEAAELLNRLTGIQNGSDMFFNGRVLLAKAHCRDRISRRRFNLGMMTAGRPVENAKHVYDWMWAHVDLYAKAVDGDCDVLATECAKAMGLADDDGSAPVWFTSIAYRVANRYDNAQARPVEIVHDTAFFAPKAIHYELDGDVLWA